MLEKVYVLSLIKLLISNDFIIRYMVIYFTQSLLTDKNLSSGRFLSVSSDCVK